MKNQASFSLKEKSKKLKCRLLQFLFGALWVIIKEYSLDMFPFFLYTSMVYEEHYLCFSLVS